MHTHPIVWLASYPKCGNTWIRFMVYAALFGVPERSSDVVARIPDIHQRDRWEPAMDFGPGPYRFIKSHFELTDDHPLLGETARAIHIIRDPRDVILSALNYRDLTGQGQRTRTKRGYVKAFARAGGDKHWKRAGFGTWASHADSWRSARRFPVLGLRYEDLKSDPAGQLERIMTFLEVPIDAERLQRTVDASSFGSMRAMELREKEKAAAGRAERGVNLFIGDDTAAKNGLTFVSKGRSGQSLEGIGPGLDAHLLKHMGKAMRSYAYGPSGTGSPEVKMLGLAARASR